MNTLGSWPIYTLPIFWQWPKSWSLFYCFDDCQYPFGHSNSFFLPMWANSWASKTLTKILSSQILVRQPWSKTKHTMSLCTWILSEVFLTLWYCYVISTKEQIWFYAWQFKARANLIIEFTLLGILYVLAKYTHALLWMKKDRLLAKLD